MGEKRLLTDFLRAERGRVILASASLFASGSLGVMLPLSIGALFGATMGSSGAKGKLLDALGLRVEDAAGFFLLFTVLVALLAAFTYLAHRLSASLTERFANDLLSRVFSAQMHASVSTHNEKPVGNYLLRYSGDMRGARDLLRKGVLQGVGDLFLLLTALGAMFWLDTLLAAVAACSFALSFLVVALLSGSMAEVAQERRDRRSRLIAFVAQRLNAFRTIKSFNRETPETKAFERAASKVTRSSERYERANGLLQVITPVLYYGSLGLVLLFAVRGSDQGRASDLLAFTLVMIYTRGPMRRSLRVNSIVRNGFSSLRKLSAIIHRPVEPRDGSDLPKDIRGEVRFADVHFSYADGSPVLRGANAVFPAHALTHLVGASGSGRSTLLALVQRIMVPQQGRITIDGIDTTTLSGFAVRKETTIVSDDVPLLGDTVLHAIVYNPKDGDEERAAKVLDRLGPFLGKDTSEALRMPLEEGGANLSRGQRRMLQFARALLTRKTILLLDEPFQDLGQQDRERIISLLNELRAGHTIILVSNHPPEDLSIDHTVTLSDP